MEEGGWARGHITLVPQRRPQAGAVQPGECSNDVPQRWGHRLSWAPVQHTAACRNVLQCAEERVREDRDPRGWVNSSMGDCRP